MEPVLRDNLQNCCVFPRLYALFAKADASNMPSFGQISAHQKKYEMQNEREIIGEIAHCAVAVGDLFGGPLGSPVKSHFGKCGVLAVTCALFVGSYMPIVWCGGGSGMHFYISGM